jgi:hypothetical protein
MGKYGASSGGEFDTEFSARNIMLLAMWGERVGRVERCTKVCVSEE